MNSMNAEGGQKSPNNEDYIVISLVFCFKKTLSEIILIVRSRADVAVIALLKTFVKSERVSSYLLSIMKMNFLSVVDFPFLQSKAA